MTTHRIKEGTREIYAKTLGINDGDTVILPPSLSDSGVKFIEIPGSKDRPVIITNADGTPVVFPEAWTYLIDCGYIHFKGESTQPEEKGLQFHFRIADQGQLGGVTFDNISLVIGDDIQRGNQIGISIKQDQEPHLIDYVHVRNSYLKGPKHGGEALYFGKGPNRIGMITIEDSHFVGWGEGPQVRFTDKVIIKNNLIEGVYPLPHKVWRTKTQGPQEGQRVLAYEPTVAAISIGDGNKEVLIEGNTVRNCGGRFLHYGSGNGIIGGNDVKSIGLEHELYHEAIRILETNDTVTIEENIFEDIKAHILWVSSSIGENVSFRNNVIIAPDDKELYKRGLMSDSNISGNQQMTDRPSVDAPEPKPEPIEDVETPLVSGVISNEADRIATLEKQISDLNITIEAKFADMTVESQSVSAAVSEESNRIAVLEKQISDLNTTIETKLVASSEESDRTVMLEKQINDLNTTVRAKFADMTNIMNDLSVILSNGSEAFKKASIALSDRIDTLPEVDVPVPPSSPSILWSTDHSTGDLSQWEDKQGQAIYNSNTEPGTSDIQISDDVAHSSKYSLKLSLTGAEDEQKQGARIFRRWLDGDNQVPLPDEGYYSAWYYITQNYNVPEWWNIFQFKSRGESSQAMFSFNVGNLDNGDMYLYVWDKANGKAHRQVEPLTLPIGQWFHLEAFVKTRFSSDGQLMVWQDGIKIIDSPDIYTLRGEGDRLHWSVNNYTDDIVPSNPVIYVDNCAISLERIGASI